MGTGFWRALRAVTLIAVIAAFAAGGANSAPSDDTTVNGEGATLATIEQNGGAVMLELAGQPSAVAYANARALGASEASAGAAGVARKRANDQAQADVLGNIASAGIDATTLYQVQSAYNGIAVQADAGAVSDLMDLPGVKAVHVIPLVELHNHSSVPLIGSQQAWGTYGMTGYRHEHRRDRHRRRLRPPRLRRLRLLRGLPDRAAAPRRTRRRRRTTRPVSRS